MLKYGMGTGIPFRNKTESEIRNKKAPLIIGLRILGKNSGDSGDQVASGGFTNDKISKSFERLYLFKA